MPVAYEWRVFNRKRLAQNVTVTVAKHHNIILFGIVDWHAHHFGIVFGLFKKTKKFLTLVLINVSLFHGEAPLVFAAALLQTAI